MTTRLQRILVAVALVAGLSLSSEATAAKRKKKCPKLCGSEVAACVTGSCEQLPRKRRARCKAQCKRTTLRACRKDADPSRCVAPGTGSSVTLVIHGRVVRAGESGSGSPSQPLAAAEVRVASDRDGSGSLGAGETTATATDAAGAYRVEAQATAGRRAVVSFRSAGLAPVIRTVNPGPGADVVLNVALRDLSSLDCSSVGGQCALAGENLSIIGLSVPLRGSARLFSPTQDADAFPGGFSDGAGSVLRPSVFAVVQLTDESGNPVTSLTEPAELCMEVPRDSHRGLTDITPGTGRIEVPLYAFDEVQGTWAREGQATLRDGAGADLPETALPAIQAGAFPGDVVACGTVTHFSWWAAAVASDAACAGLTVRTADARPAAGALVYFDGLTFAGVSPLYAAASDGAACGAVPRSEGPGEDVDGDGTTGETHRARIRILYAGKAYDGGEIVSAPQQGVCPCAGAEVTLRPENEIAPGLCGVTGRVVDLEGVGVPGAEVLGIDATVDMDTWMALCGMGGCTPVAFSGPGGAFSLSVPVVDALDLVAFTVESTYPLVGELHLPACPDGPIVIQLDDMAGTGDE